MDIEQLKLVLQSVDGVTEGAKQIGIGWLVLDFAKDLLSYGLGFYGILKASKLVYSIVQACQTTTGAESRIREMRDILVPSRALTGHVTHEEYNEMVRTARSSVNAK